MEINSEELLMYTTRIDRVDPEEWDRLCCKFNGMNVYQTGLYGDLHCKGIFRSCSRIAVLQEQEVAALAQLRIKRIPLLPFGAAEMDWGPLWGSVAGSTDLSALGKLLDEIRSEYCVKRKLQVRIRPRSTVLSDIDTKLHDLLTDRGFNKNPDVRPYHTVIIDLDKSLDTIRAEFHQKWRNQLNVAERAGLQYVCGSSIEYFDRFYEIYKKMWDQKKFPTGVRLPIIRELQNRFPEDKKFIVTLLHDGQTDIGGTVCAAFGDTMLYFLGATAPDLRNDSRPGYLLQWLHIMKAKELGMRWYDLGGYDDIDAPELARFKKRTNGLQVVYPGQYEAGSQHFSTKIFKNCEKAFRTAKRLIIGR